MAQLLDVQLRRPVDSGRRWGIASRPQMQVAVGEWIFQFGRTLGLGIYLAKSAGLGSVCRAENSRKTSPTNSIRGSRRVTHPVWPAALRQIRLSTTLCWRLDCVVGAGPVGAFQVADFMWRNCRACGCVWLGRIIESHCVAISP